MQSRPRLDAISAGTVAILRFRRGGGSGRKRGTAFTAAVEPGAPRRGAALRRMITRKTETDVQHHTICSLTLRTGCSQSVVMHTYT